MASNSSLSKVRMRWLTQSFLSASLSFFAFGSYAAAVPASADVVIVGAGLSGLTAARNLIAGGQSVVILEARNRVGGKVLNIDLKNGGVTEVGAEFVGPTQDRVLAMIADLGLRTFDVYNEGQSILWRKGQRTPYVPDPALGGAPPVDLLQLPALALAQSTLDLRAQSLNVSAPWNHFLAGVWDSFTFADWIRTTLQPPEVVFLLETLSRSVFAAETREISFLYVLAYIASAGNETMKGSISRLISVPDGAQEKRVVGGTGLIPNRLADKVGRNKIVLNAPVTAVTRTSDGYQVTSKAGKVKAKKVVVALGPTLQRSITFTPRLPDQRQKLNERMFMPAIGKGIAVYDTPFWRTDDDLNAQVISDVGGTKITFDNTPETGDFGAVMGFILGDDMRALDKKTPAEVQANLTSDFVRYFGPKANNVKEFVLQRWDLEEWSKGGPVALAPPNTLRQYGPGLRAVADGIHFAGTETAEYWTGYMDGAIRSGERVAREILGH